MERVERGKPHERETQIMVGALSQGNERGEGQVYESVDR